MKRIIFTSVLLFAVVAGKAMASCDTPIGPTGTLITGPNDTNDNLTTLLQGKTVCKKNAALTDWEWQEFHQSPSNTANNLIDWKKGPPAPGNIDPTKPVGKWYISGGGDRGASIVTYEYGPSANYTYSVWDQGGGVYDFCTTVNLTNVEGTTLKNGQVSCD